MNYGRYREEKPRCCRPWAQGREKGGPARAAKLTPQQRSDSARKAVQVRWAKASAPAIPETSKKALHLCLRRIKEANSESDLRRLTQELQQILFHRQYRNAQD